MCYKFEDCKIIKEITVHSKSDASRTGSDCGFEQYEPRLRLVFIVFSVIIL